METTRATFRLRRAEAALRSDGVTFLSSEDGALAYERRDGDGRLAVALNAGGAVVSLALGGTDREPAVLLATGRARETAPLLRSSDGGVLVDLPPRSGAVIRLA